VDLKSGKEWLTQYFKLTLAVMGKSVHKDTAPVLGHNECGTSGMAKAN
jgi:hypothetical protein